MFVRGRNERGRHYLEFTTALNISAGGALLAVRRHVPRGAQLNVEIPTAPLPEPAPEVKFVRQLRGRAVRVIHSEKCYLVGLQFSPPLKKKKVGTPRIYA